jgi:deazaflavin-dependent oxidoreductase (nitroreductase family)
VKRFGTRVHALLYRLSGGRVLGRVGGQPVLLLQTVGRRSGQTRATPLQYLLRDGAFVVVAANAGATHPPAWYLNLSAEPRALVRIRTHDVDVEAREVTGSERDAIWRQLTAANRHLADVARRAGRRIPVLVLAPATSETQATRDTFATPHRPIRSL